MGRLAAKLTRLILPEKFLSISSHLSLFSSLINFFWPADIINEHHIKTNNIIEQIHLFFFLGLLSIYCIFVNNNVNFPYIWNAQILFIFKNFFACWDKSTIIMDKSLYSPPTVGGSKRLQDVSAQTVSHNEYQHQLLFGFWSPASTAPCRATPS